MGATGDDLAKQFETGNQDLLNTISGLNDEQWQKVCSGEGWSVGVTAHHLASTRGPVMGLVHAIAGGIDKLPFTAEMLAQGNAQHAKDAANVTRNETVSLARTSGEETAKQLRAMDDQALARSTPSDLMGGSEITAAQMAVGALIVHTQEHVASIKNTIGS